MKKKGSHFSPNAFRRKHFFAKTVFYFFLKKYLPGNFSLSPSLPLSLSLVTQTVVLSDFGGGRLIIEILYSGKIIFALPLSSSDILHPFAHIHTPTHHHTHRHAHTTTHSHVRTSLHSYRVRARK